MPEESGAGQLRQQIGEILGTVRGLADTLKEVKEDRVRQEERLTNELRTVKHEQRQLDQVITSRLELLTAQFRELDLKSRAIVNDVGSVRKEVGDLAVLKDSVKKLEHLRDRLVAYGLFIVSVGGVLWAVLGPVISDFIKRVIEGKPQ
jgi:ABC-type phosphate transport system auxiliary subunit